MIRADVTSSICAMRMPAANDTTNLFAIASPSSRKTASTICGFTPRKTISAFAAISLLSVVNEMPSSVCNCARVSTFGSLARIASGVQKFFKSNPRMTEPASFPAPMKPRAHLFSCVVSTLAILIPDCRTGTSPPLVFAPSGVLLRRKRIKIRRAAQALTQFLGITRLKLM